MWNRIKSIFGAAPGEPISPYVKAGVLLIAVGCAAISPGFKEAIVSGLNNGFKLGLDLTAPWWVGGPLILIGFALLVMAYIDKRSGSHNGQFVVIRHQSFQPLAGTLSAEAMPSRMRKRKVQTYSCDQSNFLSGGTTDPHGAVRQQERLALHISGVRQSDPDAAFGYYGIVHIPLQFLAGCSVSTFPEVALFELNRNDNKWNELKRGGGPDLRPSLAQTLSPANPTGVVIKIEVSYPVADAAIADVIPSPYRQYELRIDRPGIDKITHYFQIDALAELFRQALDDVHNELPSNLPVHVFYAGPVSLGFSLGRRISRTIHNRVIVYNYTAQSSPAYSWGIDVTRDGPPEQMVMRPASLGTP